MAASHWASGLYVLTWRDAGTGRARMSWHADKDKLLARMAKIIHKDADPALYQLTDRHPLSAVSVGLKPRKPRKARKAEADDGTVLADAA